MKKNRTLAGMLFLVSLLITAQKPIENFEIQEKLKSMTSTLEKGYHSNKIWWNGWLITYSTATIAQTGIGIASDNLRMHQDMFLGALTTGLGTGFLLVTPISRIDKSKYTLPAENSNDDLETKLKYAEAELEKIAKYQASIRSWQNHALTEVVNIGCGLVTWLAFDRSFEDGIINFAMNSIITEAQIWTISTKAKKDWERYQEMNLTGLHTIKPKADIHITVAALPGGFAARLLF